ncbi:MAG: hypothetical protein LBQ16_01965 [Gracilibacteraceae bacterium]|jgi:hypothetical protein|nr:hypothetical protein [Gracilibacteraceae bacterium]
MKSRLERALLGMCFFLLIATLSACTLLIPRNGESGNYVGSTNLEANKESLAKGYDINEKDLGNPPLFYAMYHRKDTLCQGSFSGKFIFSELNNHQSGKL